MPSKPAGNSNQTTTTNSQQEVQLPQWIQNASHDIYTQGQQVAQTLQPAVAPLSAGQNAAINDLWNNIGAGQLQYQQGAQYANNVANYTPQQVAAQQVTPQMLSQANLQPYMNPFTQSVIDPSMQLLEQQRQAGNNQTADLAAKTGAFGGSRQGVAEGVNNAQSALLGGQLGAQLNMANFSQAQQAATGDIQRQLQAAQGNQQYDLQGQLANQAAGLQGQNLNLQAANTLANIGTQSSNTSMQNLMAALGGAGLQQQQQQQQMTAQQQTPIDQLQILLSTIGGIPYGHTQTGTATQTGLGPTSNPALTGLGGLSSLASLTGTIGGLFGNAAPLAALSDRTMKTDIKKVGTDSLTDLALYSYRYKGDPKTYPKTVGPMAQEVREKYPDQVIEVGGKLAIKAPFMAGLLGMSHG
jgi:hypothetical protein